MQLTDHFSLKELTDSELAERHGINNQPQALQIITNLTRVALVLEKVRMLAGGPVIISSGYRCPHVNRLAGGSKTSAHMRGLAADCKFVGKTPKEMCLAVAPFVAEWGIDQLIYEGSWMHVGLADTDAKPRGLILTAVFREDHTDYIQGIV